jgi:hypothetical protein
MKRSYAHRLLGRPVAAGHLAVAALTLAAACSNSGDTADAQAAADMTALPDLVGLDFKDHGYPAGPYAQSGNVNVGDVLPDFTFQGYWSPRGTTGLATSQAFGEVTFGMLHDSGARYAVINFAAFW